MLSTLVRTKCTTVEANVSANQKVGFFVGQDGTGKFIAATKAEPFFCIERDSEAEVIAAALLAIDLYLNVNGGNKKSQVTTQKPFTSHETRFIPKQVVFAEAC